MQHKNQKPTRFKNLYSKFKEFCALHNIPTLVFPILALLVIACIVLAIGGAVLGWNIAGALTSSAAILIYSVFTVLLIALIYYWLTNRE